MSLVIVMRWDNDSASCARVRLLCSNWARACASIGAAWFTGTPTCFCSSLTNIRQDSTSLRGLEQGFPAFSTGSHSCTLPSCSRPQGAGSSTIATEELPNSNHCGIHTWYQVISNREYCSIGGFDSRRNGTCTIHCLKANRIIIVKYLLDASRRGKKGLMSSRDQKKNQGTNRSWEGGRRACYVTPNLGYDQEGEIKRRANRVFGMNKNKKKLTNKLKKNNQKKNQKTPLVLTKKRMVVKKKNRHQEINNE